VIAGQRPALPYGQNAGSTAPWYLVSMIAAQWGWMDAARRERLYAGLRVVPAAGRQPRDLRNAL